MKPSISGTHDRVLRPRVVEDNSPESAHRHRPGGPETTRIPPNQRPNRPENPAFQLRPEVKIKLPVIYRVLRPRVVEDKSSGIGGSGPPGPRGEENGSSDIAEPLV